MVTNSQDLYFKNFYRNQQSRRKSRFFKRLSQDTTLMDLESQAGKKIFGQTTRGIRREFFAVNETSWIWHEEWIDGKGNLTQFTTRYELRKNKIVKIQPGPRYFEVKGQELHNFYRAVEAYHKTILSEIYRKAV